MIVKILGSAATFSGVNYNSEKVRDGRGELMKVSGFGSLQMLSGLRPADYINYFKAISSQNRRVSKPQFHAVISAEGRSADKQELTAIAERWLEKMGYSKNPYLIVFHNDTENNHVHMVSTRINRSGKKISAAFEKIRAVLRLNQVLGLDESKVARKDLLKALSYKFSTLAQFKLLLENRGYSVKETRGSLEIIKFGRVLLTHELAKVEESINTNAGDNDRTKQLKGIFAKYLLKYNADLTASFDNENGNPCKINSYTSDFSRFMKSKMGIELIFHFKDDKPPYGYTIIDHTGKNVFKGSEIISLKNMGASVGRGHYIEPAVKTDQVFSGPIFSASGLDKLTGHDYYEPLTVIPSIDLAEDIDDEAINGRNRQRKGMARTNTR